MPALAKDNGIEPQRLRQTTPGKVGFCEPDHHQGDPAALPFDQRVRGERRRHRHQPDGSGRDRRLAKDGVAVLHTIGNVHGPGRNNPWIEKYIFPGGIVPALSQIAQSAERAGLIITDVEILRSHYADTLRAWSERFQAHRDEVRALYDERFCRMWEFYLAGAEAAFREGDLVVLQVQMAKDRNAVPQTRDYITDSDRAGGLAHRIAAE